MNGKPIRILLVEDNLGDARLFQEMLAETEQASFDLTHVQRLNDGLAKIAEEKFDVMMLDLSLPDSQGLDTFDRAHAVVSDIPIVLLTGLNDEETAVQALQKGAQDYLVKGVLGGRWLARVIRYAIERHRLWTEYKQMENELRAAQKMEAVGELTAGVAHNFNNILQGIIGYVELATSQDLPAPARKYLGKAKDLCEREAGIVRQLMLFVQGETPIERVSIDLREVMGRVVESYRTEFDQESEIVLSETEGRSQVAGSIDRLEQVFLNLCLNARDALISADRNPLRISVAIDILLKKDLSVPPNGASGRYVRVQIEDKGIGMKAETRERIFEPFFTTREENTGHGLGLSTAYGIVQEHGGWIECESEWGQGTTFSVYLPMIVQDDSIVSRKSRDEIMAY